MKDPKLASDAQNLCYEEKSFEPTITRSHVCLILVRTLQNASTSFFAIFHALWRRMTER